MYTSRKLFGSRSRCPRGGLITRGTWFRSAFIRERLLKACVHVANARVPAPLNPMVINALRLRSFRVHERTDCSFAPKVNLLFGPNGAGKTNILEAVHYACLSKGFVTSSDRYIVRKGAAHVEVEATFSRDEGRDLRVRLVYVPGQGKQLFVNSAPLERLSEIVGQLPVVVYSPQDHVLTAGGPDERRRFVDNILSQARPAYLDTLLKFRRVLKQRNRLLGRYQESRSGPPSAALEPWTEELIQMGSRIVAVRAAFSEEFTTFLDRAYKEIEAVVERPTLQYETVGRVKGASEDEIAGIYREQLEAEADKERRRGLTLVGPHRDELVFRLNGLLVRRYASQGQHRTFGMAMKLAKYFYLHDHTGEYPLLLLDDVFDHLDRKRSNAFLELLQSDRIGQTLITATDRASFAGMVPFDHDRNRSLYVREGTIREESLLTGHTPVDA